MTKTSFAFLTVFLAFLLINASQALAGNSNINKKEPPPSSDTVAQFTKVIDDLPLMPGLEPVDENDVLFIAHTGRIAETTANGPVDVDDVYQFYAKTLPQLGWRMVDVRTYERTNERLRIDASSVTPNATTNVRFSVKPLTKNE